MQRELSQTIRPFHNQGLFDTDYLLHVLPKSDVWREDLGAAVKQAVLNLWQEHRTRIETYNEAQLGRYFIRPILDTLGHCYEIEARAGSKQADYALFSDESARRAWPPDGSVQYWSNATGPVEAKAWGTPLDRSLSRTTGWSNVNPSYQIDYCLRATGKRWGILTNGREWRLYNPYVQLPLEDHYSVDVPALIEREDEWSFVYFWLFFRREAFATTAEGTCFLDLVRDQKLVSQEELQKILAGPPRLAVLPVADHTCVENRLMEVLLHSKWGDPVGRTVTVYEMGTEDDPLVDYMAECGAVVVKDDSGKKFLYVNFIIVKRDGPFKDTKFRYVTDKRLMALAGNHPAYVKASVPRRFGRFNVRWVVFDWEVLTHSEPTECS